jgi:hypothetical protein
MATEKVKHYDDEDLLLLPEFHYDPTPEQKAANDAWHLTHDKKGWGKARRVNGKRGC